MSDKKYLQKYRSVWETDKRFQGWLQGVPGDTTKAHCSVCGHIFQAHMKTILGHASGKKHRSKLKSVGIEPWSEDQTPVEDALPPVVKNVFQPVITEVLRPVAKDALRSAVKSPVRPVVKDVLRPVVKDVFRPVEKDHVKVAELLVAVYIAEHTSASFVDHLWEILPKLDPKSVILKEIKLHRTKCARLQKYVIAPSFVGMLRDDIGEHFFSLNLDEITNEFNVSCLAMSIRYFSASKGSLIDTFYRLVPIDNAKAETLYTSVKSCLAEDGLDSKRILGLGIDGASSMVDRTHSLSKLLRDDNPELTLFTCVSHSLHLAVSVSSECLPTILDFMVRETHSWFSNSPKRTKEYQALYQALENSDQKKVPRLAGIRWLARLEAVSVIVDEWDALKMNFELAAANEHCHTTSILADGYKNDQNKLYFLFIRKTLMELVKVNKILQSQNADITKFTQELITLYRVLLHIVVNPKHLSKCSDEDLPSLSFLDYVLPCEEINFGYEFQIYSCVASLDHLQISHVKERCRAFVNELITQVHMRLPENLEILLKFKHFHPTAAASNIKESITAIAARHRSTFNDLDALENEWNLIGIHRWPMSCLGNVTSFWGEVSERKTSAGEAMFPNISSLALSLLSLPFANASVERIFSQVNVLHSKVKTRLGIRSLEALLQIRSGLSLHYGSCTEFNPPQDMLRNFHAKGTVEDDEDDFMALE